MIAVTANNCTANGSSFDVNLNTCRYDPSKLIPAMREAVANTLGIHGVPPRFVPR